MAKDVSSRGRGLPDNSQTIGQQAIPAYFATGGQQDVSSLSLSFGNVVSEGSSIIDFTHDFDDDIPVLADNEEFIFTGISINSVDDTAINNLVLTKETDGYVFFDVTFVTSGKYSLEGIHVSNPDYLRITINNFSDSTLTFVGTIFWIIRKKEV